MMLMRQPTGCGTALVTPFRRDGAVDEDALRRLVEWQISEGVHFVVPCGSTGEAATMSLAEHRRVVEITVEVMAGRVPVVAGAGSNDTAKAVALSKKMKAGPAGADRRCERDLRTDHPALGATYKNVTFEEIEIGKPVSVSRPVTHTEVEAMALVSGEVDPYHVEPGALDHGEGPVSAQAVGAEAILSGLLNRRLPGPGTRIVSQSLEFRGKIRTGETVTATVTAREKHPLGNRVVFDCRVTQSGIDLIAGTVTVEAPTRRIAYDEVATPQIN